MRLKLKWKIIFSIILVLILLIICLNIIGNIGIKVREYTISNTSSPIYGLKIVQFSDLYYGKSMNEKKLNNLVNMINKTKPDIVIFSGDLIDSNTDITIELSNQLKKYLTSINASYGKYYVKGDLDKSSSFDNIMSSSNFNSISSNEIVIYTENGNILLSGIDTNKTISENVVDLLNTTEFKYKIFVSHYPDKIDDIIKYNYDLILASHSLNGQVRLPLINGIFKFDNSKKYNEEYYKINDSNMYITGGLGNKILDIRLFNTPSFNLYRIA